MIVIVTRRGGAPAVADAITHAGLSQVLGAVGGVDTVLAATGSVTQAEDLVQFLRKIGR